MCTATLEIEEWEPQSTEPLSLRALLPTTADLIKQCQEFSRGTERWPRLRSADRQQISQAKRYLIFERDGWRCVNCFSSNNRGYMYPYELQLDHIIPWSAWGSDCSCNLRALCKWCNNARSNKRSHLDTGPRMHVAVGCTACDPEPVEAGYDMIAAYCGSCGETAPTYPGWVL